MTGRAPAIAGLLFVVLLSAACAPSEQPLLDEFFNASRLRDLTALQHVSTVVFEPREQGIVRTFQITTVSAERTAGTTTQKDVTLDASVLRPDGTTVQQTLKVTLQRSGDHAGHPWIVVAVKAK